MAEHATETSAEMESGLHQPHNQAAAVDPAPSSPTAATPTSLTRNQERKRQRRQLETERRSQQQRTAIESDPLCARLVHARDTFRQRLSGRFRAARSRTPDDRCEAAAAATEEGQSKRQRTATADPPAAADAACRCNEQLPPPLAQAPPQPRSGILASDSGVGAVVDHALQIQASYTSHRLRSGGLFEAMSDSARKEHPPDDTDVFRLDAPYQQHQQKVSGESVAQSDSAAASSLHASTVVFYNKSEQDEIVEHAGERYVLPPQSTAILGDIREAAPHLLKARPANGFQLVVVDPVSEQLGWAEKEMDKEGKTGLTSSVCTCDSAYCCLQPWESKSVRRAKRYECLDPSELKQLPVGELLPAEGPCIVAVWVTNNPAIASFVREQLFPAWHVQYLATWHWLKVLPLQPASAANYRKPYEQLLIGGRRMVAASSTSEVGLPSASESSSSNSAPRSLPSEYALISVPGSKQHSRKPQLAEILAPYLPTHYTALELFARNLVRGWTSWGNQCLLFQV